MMSFSENRLVRIIRHKFVQRLIYALLFFGFALSAGVIGFILIEGYTVSEAFYMTIITISTVGYGEVRPLSNAGRTFTALLIIFNIGAFTYAVSVVSAFIFEGDLKAVIKEKQMESEIKKLKGHVIVCGYGRLGRLVCQDLEAEGKQVLIVEHNKAMIEDLMAKEKLCLEGDATEDEVIGKMGIERAETFITTFHSDAANIFVVLSARELQPGIQIISRASSEANISKLRLAGADHVIIPEDIGGAYIAAIATGKEHLRTVHNK